MAGMLPGVECARRRRFHQSGGSLDSSGFGNHRWTRRSSFCLYTTSHEQTRHTSSLKGSLLNQTYQDQNLGVEAREARERLDERLRIQKKPESKRQSSGKGGLRCKDEISYVAKRELQMEVCGAKKSGSRKFNWAKMSWKVSDEDECAVCLEKLRVGETLLHLPCTHRFHSGCLVPWLENNAHCPCCRMGIILQ